MMPLMSAMTQKTVSQTGAEQHAHAMIATSGMMAKSDIHQS